MNYWIVKARRYNQLADAMRPGVRQTWHTYRIPRGFERGDRVFIWASSPDLFVAGLAMSLGPTGKRNEVGHDLYRIEFVTPHLLRPVTISEVRSSARLAKSTFVTPNVQQGVLALSQAEAKALFNLVIRDNPTTRTLWRSIPRTTRSAPRSGLALAEGAPVPRLHMVRERAPALVRAKLAAVLDSAGRLKCEACRFDFARKYGWRGRGFAEVHHLEPLGDSKPKRITSLHHLAVLCANCHRMIHRCWPLPRTVRAFRREVGIEP